MQGQIEPWPIDPTFVMIQRIADIGQLELGAEERKAVSGMEIVHLEILHDQGVTVAILTHLVKTATIGACIVDDFPGAHRHRQRSDHAKIDLALFA